MSVLHPRRALISVSDKSGLLEFAGRLVARGVELISTGGTYRALTEAGIAAREVAELTGFPEMMDGRVKTLHPKIHGAILARRGRDDAARQAHGIDAIDLVVVNLYPFERTVARADASLAEAIENIDIGGPALLRGAAKNHADVAVVVDPADYAAIAQAIEGAGIDAAWRRRLATRAFALTASYDAAVAAYLSALDAQERRAAFPGVLGLQYDKKQDLRYGENPHQRAAFYTLRAPPPGSVAASRQVQGKDLSYNNIADAEAALECVKCFAEPACVIVKHANPCGVAECTEGIAAAYERAYRTDPTSAFGGIIAFNRELDGATAQAIVERQFVEVILAPQASAEAQRIIGGKQNLRLLECGGWTEAGTSDWDLKGVTAGLLVQERDNRRLRPDELQVVSRRQPSGPELRDLMFAWTVAKFVKSNAIVYARERATLGIGAGQMSRVYSARIAGIKAADEGLAVAGSVMASDAFFPFRDGIDAAAAAGITAVVQPGGSVRDAEVIAAADGYGMAMVFTGVRHFRH